MSVSDMYKVHDILQSFHLVNIHNKIFNTCYEYIINICCIKRFFTDIILYEDLQKEGILREKQSNLFLNS